MSSSRSCANLLDLVAEASGGDFSSPKKTSPRFPRVMTVPGIISDFDEDDDLSTPAPERRIIVSNQLPLRVYRDGNSDDPRQWKFEWDHDALVLQLRSGFPPDTEFVYVGVLKNADVDAKDQDDLEQILFDRFRCVPVFLSSDVQNRFYHGFCKHYLWPLFHYMLPLSPTNAGARFDRGFWQGYLFANKTFANKIMEIVNPDDDYVWIHDYHLMILPTFLRRRSYRIKLGFFLHSPFPSSEMYRTIPVREEILRALLNCDLVGFHTFDYARHFLSCCSRMLGLAYESKRGYIGLEYYGRTVIIKILPVGIDMNQMESVMEAPQTADKIKDLMRQYKGKTILLGVDDMDMFKGISLKFMAMGQLLEENPELRGEVVLVQIANPARSTGRDVQEVQDETHQVLKIINDRYGKPGYDPIIFINRPVSTLEKVAYYAVSECVVVNAVRDGMNLVPYKYTVCRDGSLALDGTDKKSVIIVSEFIGCSPSLSGAIRVNPWNVDAVSQAMNLAIKMTDAEKILRHEKHYKYVKSHDVAYWAKSFDNDLQKACKDHFNRRCWGIGFALCFRIVALDRNFKKLSLDHIVPSYRKTTSRLILLDYDGTMMPQAKVDKRPSAKVMAILKCLCDDPKNVVFVVSGRGKEPLTDWFDSVDQLGIASEHGFFTRLVVFSIIDLFLTG